ncbi:MBL fold metallo-hydrolase [Parasporobacterium paucivorans]|uniref:Glyoxylase, beta-lactamase superfamily II n=1 Tax=Parasporobacterium paucivorans DSM 15970 TaxID=1122934 RepID=A0A1M6C5Z9_9FIRM|nr:MBL fold metallo-hydrolase [Parasporobacterium paucivorans]SHI56174.1 Glyoxylase, beta-lactamase superfamily II [Parasporobacterium paucivorans DSM 15970]
MKKAEIRGLRLGPLFTNTYFVANTETKEAFLVDPADDPGRIAEMLEDNDWNLKAILLTHGHIDHIGAVDEVRRSYGVQVYAHKDEVDVLSRPEYNLSTMLGYTLTVKPDVLVTDGQMLDIAGLSIKVIHTPGHTRGGCCYLLQEEKILLSGDTLFYSSYGRTDFPGGSESALMRSIKEKLLTLDDDITVYPGHEMITKIGDEKRWY